MRKLLTVAALLVFVLPQPGMSQGPDASLAGSPENRPAYAPGELLVKYRASVRSTAAGYYRSRWGMSTLRRFRALDIEHLKLPEGMTVKEGLQLFLADPDVEYAEPNYYRYATVIPDDTEFNRLWGLNNTGQTGGTADADIDAPEAWDITQGSSDVVVAVIDTGIDYNHPDLAGNIWVNPGEIPANGIDDDGNGYVDDVRGWDFFEGDNDSMDANGHGTHVAGTIAAVGNNFRGVAGVSWSAKLMPLRFQDATGTGSVVDEIAAIDYAIDNGADIVNASFGALNTASLLEQEAISKAESAGILFVAAGGNAQNNNDITGFYPASYETPNIISVAATDQDDQFASNFSNYGSASVDVAAPGVNIYSTTLNDQYGFRTGTSMATPHVSGSAALLKAYDNTLTYNQFKEAIEKTTDFHPSLENKVATEGRVNAYNALSAFEYLPEIPSEPQAVALSEDSINLTWKDNSSNEYGFIIERRKGISGSYAEIETTDAKITNYTDTNLEEQTVYTYRILAYCHLGKSASSSETSAETLLAAPTGLSAQPASNSRIDLTWTDNSSLETKFTIERKRASSGNFQSIATLGSNAAGYHDSGLKEGSNYTYRVSCSNIAGNSAYSNEASATTHSSDGGGGGGGCFIRAAAP